MSLVAPGLCSLQYVVAALTAATVALLLAAARYGLGLIIAALVALVLGAEVERSMGARS